MKQFAFPLSVKYNGKNEREAIIEILDQLGYRGVDITDELCIIVTNIDGKNGIYSNVWHTFKHDYDRHHIDHFNPDIIRDIAAACTNDTWQKDELWVSSRGELSIVTGYAGFSVNPNGHRRPTLAEICAHHGYEIKGRDIVKKVETVYNVTNRTFSADDVKVLLEKQKQLCANEFIHAEMTMEQAKRRVLNAPIVSF